MQPAALRAVGVGLAEGVALVDSSSLLQRFRLNQWRRIRLVTARQSFVCCLRAAEKVKEEEMLVYNKGDDDDDEIDEWIEDGMPEWVEDGMPSTLFAAVKEQGLDGPLASYAPPPPPPAATSMAAAATATSSAIEPGTIEVVATIGDTRVSVLRKDLEDEESIGDVDPRFFDPDYSVAASTGMVMWEGSWAAVELLRKENSWLLDMLEASVSSSSALVSVFLGCALRPPEATSCLPTCLPWSRSVGAEPATRDDGAANWRRRRMVGCANTRARQRRYPAVGLV